MTTPLLVIDAPNLCHRAFHALGGGRAVMPASSKDVVYSFLQTLKNLNTRFGTDRFAFCFDHSVSYRRQIFPEYKQKRQQAALEDAERRKSLSIQIRKLRKKYLPELGFRNIFRARGMEADDLMAAIVQDREEDEIVLVTSDSDLMQCLRKNVSIYNPNKKEVLTRRAFIDTYDIYPKQWAKVKAIAGCPTDGIPGLLGVGQATALKYFRNQLKETSSPYYWITCEKGQEAIAETLRLVKLPFAGCPTPKLREDDVAWERIGRTRL